MWLRALAGTSVGLLLVAVACGDTYDSADTPADAGQPEVTARPLLEAGPDVVDAGPPRCQDPRAPFTKIERVPGIPTGAFCARFSADESYVTFSINPNETRQATRGADGAYGAASKVDIADANPVCAHFSADRTFVYFEDFFAVYVASGPAGGPYTGKTPVDRGDAPNLGDPFFDEAHGLLYTDYHLTPYQFFINAALGVAKVTGGTTTPTRRIDVGFGLDGGEGPREAGTPAEYKFGGPTPTADGLALYFATIGKPDGGAEPANADIYVSTRSDPSSDFSNPTLVEGVSSPLGDTPSWISPDGCRLYLHSSRNHPDGTLEIFVATRTP